MTTAPGEPKGTNTPEEDYQQLGFFAGYLERHEDDRKRNLLARPGRQPATVPTIQEGKKPTQEQLDLALEAALDSNVRDLNLTAMRLATVVKWVYKRQENSDERLEKVLQAQKERPNRRELWTVLLGVWSVGLILGFVIACSGDAVLDRLFFGSATPPQDGREQDPDRGEPDQP